MTDDPLLIHAYLDGELDLANALAIEQRMASDPAMREECQRIEAVQRMMREHLSEEAAPPGLRSRIETAVGLRGSAPRSAHAQFSWRAIAASVVFTAFVTGGAMSILRAPLPTEAVRNGVVDAHIRSLMAQQPVDVASSDRHTVKPWFAGRIPEAPRVIDLASSDFPLVGGRIDVIGEVPVPTLIYNHRKHLISLMAIPRPRVANAAPIPSMIDGYNLVRWTQDGILYWAISDVAAADLEHFADLFRTAPPDQ